MTFLSKIFKKKEQPTGYSVPRGKPIKRDWKIKLFYQKIRTFINNKIYSIRIQANVFATDYNVKEKSLFLLSLIINILVTGLAIKYCVDNRNILSYGLAAVLIIYYLEKVVEIIKKPYNEDKK